VEKEPAVALKFAVVALAAIDTVAGAEMRPVELKEIEVAEAEAALIVTVQVATAPGARAVGLHVTALTTGVLAEEAVPPVPVTASWLPSIVAPIPLANPTDAEVAPAARVTATVATLPLAIRELFIPLATHV
jgi:hypothetical protein